MSEGRYIARKRPRFKGFDGPVNIPWGASLEVRDAILYWNGAAVCGVSSQNAYDYFSRDDDGQGEFRGKLVGAIKATLEKRDAGYQARWNKVWADPRCERYKRPEHEDWWVWNYDFYNAPIPDLQYIASLVGAKVR